MMIELESIGQILTSSYLLVYYRILGLNLVACALES